MTEVITVTPERDGWLVSRRSTGESHRFAGGQTAETMARQLGAALSEDGTAAEIVIVLRDGSLAAKIICRPQRLSALV